MVTIKNRRYNVISDFDNAGDAAQLMSDTNDRLIAFMGYLASKYKIDASPPVIPTDPTERRRYNLISAMLKNYNPDDMYETDLRTTSDTSYTTNKVTLHVCLRNKKDPNILVDPDVLCFVLLHELSHMAYYDGWGHPEEFWQIFKYMLQEAQASGIYNNVDYSKDPTRYCGLDVEYNPYFDPKIANLFTVS